GGIMVRDSTAANAAYAMVDITPSNGVEFSRRLANGNTTTTFNNVTGISAPEWVKLVRSGNVFTAYYSSDGSTWTLLGTDSVSVRAYALAGLIACSHNNGTATTATFTNVSIGPTPPSGWTTPTGGGLNLVTQMQVDALGRETAIIYPAANITYTT